MKLPAGTDGPVRSPDPARWSPGLIVPLVRPKVTAPSGASFIRREVPPDKWRSSSRFHRFPETRLPQLTVQLPPVGVSLPPVRTASVPRPQSVCAAGEPRFPTTARFQSAGLADYRVTVSPLSACSQRKHAAGSAPRSCRARRPKGTKVRLLMRICYVQM